MKTQAIEIEWENEEESEGEPGEEDVNGAMCCPECNRAWIFISNGEADIPRETDCPHLKFIIEPGTSSPDEFHYYNGFSKEQLLQSAEKAYRQLVPDGNCRAPEEMFSEILFDETLLEKAAMDGVNTIVCNTQEAICCGPVSQTVYFGAVLEPAKERA